MDSVYQNLRDSREKGECAGRSGAEAQGIFPGHGSPGRRTWTIANRLERSSRAWSWLASEFGLPVIFPMHPRTRKMVTEFGLELDGIRAIEPVGFLEFLQLEANARLALTDSGGVQEETCILGVPCVTLRENTERPETVDVGANPVSCAWARMSEEIA